MEGRRLRLFENRVQRRIFGPERDEAVFAGVLNLLERGSLCLRGTQLA
jgi:hypothetical protein